MPQGKLSLHFIVPNGKTKEMCSKDMHVAFQACENLKLQPRWEAEMQCMGRESNRQDVFVFDTFEGKLFSSLKMPLCVRVVGPRCLLTCMRRNISIPDTMIPVYTAAMHNVSVTTTQLDSELKGEIKQLVTSMGGMYCNSLRGCVTHVVVGHVISVKCQESRKKNIQLMTVEWVRVVWEASLTRDIVAVDEEFQKYRCPLFYGVIATCTKLRTAEKNELAALIQKNGGAFTGFLDASTTNLLIVGDPTGDKFLCAQQNDISCLSMQWVRDCVAAGDIMPFEDYVMVKEGKQCSTPVHDQSKFLPDFSTVSSIDGRPPMSRVDETLNITLASIGEPSNVSELTLRNLPSAQQVEEAVQHLVASNNLHAGPYLDGCKIFLSGFSTLQLDRLRRVLNRAGATRIDEISEALTHVVVGRVNSVDMKLVKSFTHKPHVVSVQWLVQCARLEYPASEEQFLCYGNSSSSVEPPSPLSKKGVAALQHTMARSVPAFPALEPVQEATSPPAAVPEQQPAEDLMHQYLHSQPGDETVENAPVGKAEGNESPVCKVVEIDPEDDSNSQAEFTAVNFFDGLVFEILGFEEEPESEEMIMETVLATGGRMNQGRVADYAITPCLVDQNLSWNAQHAVNYLWLEECGEQQQVLPEPLDYFYRTAKVNLDSRPLEGCVLTPSSYVGRERTFLIHLMQALGARVQHVFSRIAVPDKDLLPATHLITQDNSSPKFRAAVKWRLLVVSHEWLLACVAENCHVEESPFLIYDTSKSGSGEEVSAIDKTGVKHTPKKVPQGISPASQTNSSSSTNASKTSPCESVCRAVDAPGTVCALGSHAANPDTDKSNQQRGSVVSNQVSSAVTPTTYKSDQDPVSVKADTRVSPVVTSIIDRVEQPLCGQAEKRSTPVNWLNNPAARKSRLPNQSPATGTPVGPPTFTTPVDSHRRLGMLFSQETPLKYGGAEPSTPSTPRDPNYISTPETPYGQFLVSDPSPNTRKNWKRWLDTVPDFPKADSPPKKRRDSTPVSELKHRIWNAILPNKQGDGSGGTDVTTTDVLQDGQVPDLDQTPVRTLTSLGPVRLSKLEVSVADCPREAAISLEPRSPCTPDVDSRLSMPTTQSIAEECERDARVKAGPGVHTQIVRLNEALSAKKQQDSGGGKKKRCADPDKSNSSVDVTVSMEHSKEYKALMGVEVPTEIAVTWEYRQYSEQSEPQTQSQDTAVSTPRVFSLSGIDAQRANYEKVIKSLGGEISQSSTYDPVCTHLVCERLTRSERMLGSIAAGKWVLHPSYLTDSEQAGHFLAEEKYEWGSPACQPSRELAPNSLPHTLATAAHRWRCKVAQDGCTAFSGLKVLVHVGKDRQDQFKRCVQAGGGKVVLLSDWCTANVCIVDVNKVSLDKPISLAAFVRNNIPCVPTLFLHEYLMREPTPSPAEFAIAEYKELYRQREQHATSSSC